MNYYLSKLKYYWGRPSLWKSRLIAQFPQFVKNDETFVRAKWLLAFGYPLDLNNTRTFNEKLQWLKLYDHQPKYTQMVDKIEVKKYVSQIMGEEHIIKTIGVFNNFDEIDFTSLPNRFVLKVAHDSGGVVVCKDKLHLDKNKARHILCGRQKRNYYVLEREWPYKNVKPRILCEEYKEDSSGYELKDYKFFCFNGVAKFFKIDFDRFTDHHANYFKTDGTLLPFGEKNLPPKPDKKLEMPHHLTEMIKYAEILSREIPFVRVDFYEANDIVYFGEITFYPASGRSVFTDNKWDDILGSYIDLPKEKRI